MVEGLTADPDLLRLRHYLGLDEPLVAIESELAKDRLLRSILPHTSGIALLRQDPWECLISFIISAFNNIPKIELSLDRLTRRFGDAVAGGAWSFPEPARLAGASLGDLRQCALGYRAPYVREVARLMASGQSELHAIEQMPFHEARRALRALPGVGEKVADCVLLFAYRRGEAFPVDVWVKRAVERWYLHGRRATARQVQEFARRRFGSNRNRALPLVHHGPHYSSRPVAPAANGCRAALRRQDLGRDRPKSRPQSTHLPALAGAQVEGMAEGRGNGISACGGRRRSRAAT